MTDLSDLISRVRKADGPDRELDWRIADLLNIPEKWPSSSVWPPFMDGSKFDKAIPNFTSSLDAITALIERKLPGCMKRVFDNPDDGSVRSQIVTVSGLAVTADHDTWPLSLCLALLLSLQEISK